MYSFICFIALHRWPKASQVNKIIQLSQGRKYAGTVQLEHEECLAGYKEVLRFRVPILEQHRALYALTTPGDGLPAGSSCVY